jgi:HlyD family secretion protein/epimerase transport system membrane fusion protein
MTMVPAPSGGFRLPAVLRDIKLPVLFQPATDVAPEHADLAPYLNTRSYVRVAGWVGLITLGSILLWSVLVPLAKGAIAHGTISVQSQRKTIQHLEGGVIREILVQEGSIVKAGQPLMILDRTQAEASSEIVGNQLLASRAYEARLTAQRNDAAEVTFPDEVLERAKTDTKLAELIEGQRRAFESNRGTISGKRKIYEEQIEQQQKQITGLDAQNKSYATQRKYIDEEIKGVKFLLDQGLERLPRMLALQRTQSGLDGQMEANRADMERIKQAINETRLKITDLNNTYRDQATEELRQVQDKIAELRERSRAAENVLGRTTVVAPLDGIVMNLKYHTIGGTVQPYAPILDMVPTGDDLVITAQISPMEIESIEPGMDAWVTLSAFNQRRVPQMPGKVTEVSPDRFEDQRTGAAYYQAQVRIDKDSLAKVPNLKLFPGMPAEVKIVTGYRTAWDYFFQPVHDSFNRAFVAQ